MFKHKSVLSIDDLYMHTSTTRTTTLVDGESTHATQHIHPFLHLLLVLGHQIVHPQPGLYVKHKLVLLVGEVRVHTGAVFQVYYTF